MTLLSIIHLILSVFFSFLHYRLLTFSGEKFFSLPLFVITFLLVFFFRFFRFPIRNFYFFSFCPVISAFFSYLSPFSGAFASFLSIFLFGHFILKNSIESVLYGSSSYLSGALFLSLIRYLNFSINLKLLIFLIITSFLYPLFFYFPLILKSRFSFKKHLYILSREIVFLFFYTSLIFFILNFLRDNNIYGFIILIPVIFISILTLRDSLKLDRLFLLHKIEESLAGVFSLEKAFQDVKKILLDYIPFDSMKVFVKENENFKCIFSDDKNYVGEIFSFNLFNDLLKNERIYIKKREKDYKFISKDTLSFYAISLYRDNKLSGLIIFESKLEDNFSEDDRERLLTVSYLVSRIIGNFLLIQELPNLSETIMEKSSRVIEMLKNFASYTSRFGLSLSHVEGSFRDIQDKISKNFDILENIAREFEKGSSELSSFVSFFRSKRSLVEMILYSLKIAEESFGKLIEEFKRLKDNIFMVVTLLEKIQGFVEFMKDYASKTRLLSLNASIEATRMGEEAKGFSIIAEEIGTLAQSVENVITKLTHEFSSTSEILENTKNFIVEYEKLIENYKRKFTESGEKEKELLINTLDLLPKIENLPLFFETTVFKLTEVIRLIGEELQETETGNQKMKEILDELKEINYLLEKIENGINECKLISDRMRILEEEIRSG
ncbi:MAG: methyl-accepting chemotaxis protein [candidate division WOR-3 bacterium]